MVIEPTLVVKDLTPHLLHYSLGRSL